MCVVWDVEKGKAQGRLTEHGHYVQGVAWDPSQQYVVSQSADRTCRFATHPLHSYQSQYVQGMAWDPAQHYVVSQSADRTYRYAVLSLRPWACATKAAIACLSSSGDAATLWHQ